MSGHVEWRDADVRRGQTRRHRLMTHRASAGDPLEACRRLPHRSQFGSVADQHSRHVPTAAAREFAHRLDEMDCTMPGPERAGKHRDDLAGPSRGNGTVPSTPGRKRSVSAPHSTSSTRSGPTDGGTIAALGVTMSAAAAQRRLRQRRIGSISSARLSFCLGEFA